MWTMWSSISNLSWNQSRHRCVRLMQQIIHDVQLIRVHMQTFGHWWCAPRASANAIASAYTLSHPPSRSQQCHCNAAASSNLHRMIHIFFKKNRNSEFEGDMYKGEKNHIPFFSCFYILVLKLYFFLIYGKDHSSSVGIKSLSITEKQKHNNMQKK